MSKGIAALPTVLIISIIILIGGIGIAGSGLIESFITFGDYESKQALYVAEAGAQDAFKRLVRDKSCTCSYTLSVSGGTATIMVSGTNPKTVTSLGQSGLKKRKIQLTISWDTNDEATQSSWKEVTD